MENNENGIHRISAPGNWLAGGELHICAVQPPEPVNELQTNAARPVALKLAERLLSTRLSHTSPRTPTMVLFPELAFGTPDFAKLDDWVARLRAPTIVLAGFGFCSGKSLQALLHEHDGSLRSAWPEDEDLDPDGTYNGGWCWVHQPGQEPLRAVFLKHFAEQRVEISIDGWTPGTHIVRIDTDDLTIFPLICADLICNRPKSGSYPGNPRLRIRASLDADEHRDRRVLVVGLLYSENTFSDHWKHALDNLAANDADERLAAFLVNHAQPDPRENQGEDAWRSLTGAFLARSRMPGPPANALPHVRYVETPGTRGLVLRLTRPGTAEGPVRWRCGSDRGASVWMPTKRHVWVGTELVKVGAGAKGWELSRFLVRKKEHLLEQLHENLRPMLDKRLRELRSCLDVDPGGDWVSNLWPRILHGLNPTKEQVNPDHLNFHEGSLARAVRVLAALNAPGLARLALEAMPEAQLFLQGDLDHHLMIWKDPQQKSRHQIRSLEKLVDEGGRPGLVIIGEGATGQEPAQKIEFGRRSKITRPGGIYRSRVADAQAPQQAEIRRVTRPRCLRPVYWLPLRELENVLDEDDDWPEDAGMSFDQRLKDLIDHKLQQIEGAAA